MNGFEIIGYLAGLLTAVCFLPQTLETLKTRKTDGISPLSYVIYSCGLGCWILYGTYLGSVQMIIFNLIALVFALAILSVTLINKKKGR